MHSVIFSCKRKQIQTGRVGRAAACLDSTPKTSEEWRENRCDKRGWTSTQTSAMKGGKSVTSCRETASLLFRYAPLHSAGEKLEFSSCIKKHSLIHIRQKFLPRTLVKFNGIICIQFANLKNRYISDNNCNFTSRLSNLININQTKLPDPLNPKKLKKL